MFSKSILLFCIEYEEWGFLKILSEKNFAFLCIYWKMRFLKSILLFYIENWEFLRSIFWKMLYSYVLYWMMFLKSNLMFCIAKWGMRISKNSFRKIFASYVLYWKIRFLKSILLFFYWKMRISKISFPKNVTFLCIILKNDIFEVKSYDSYWKMRNEDF